MASEGDGTAQEQPSRDTRVDVIPPYQPSGLYYALWRLIWPWFLELVRRQEGPPGLRPPDQKLTKQQKRRVFWQRIAWPFVLLVYAWRRWKEGPDKKHPSMLLDDLGWWELYIAGSVRRVLGHGDVVHLTVVLAGAFLSVGGILAKYESSFYWFVVWVMLWIYITFPLFLLSVCYAAYATLRVLPPEDYAIASLAGRPEPVVMRALAYEMRAGVRQFLSQISDLDKQLRKHPWLGKPGEEGKPKGGELKEFFVAIERDRTIEDNRQKRRQLEEAPRRSTLFSGVFATKEKPPDHEEEEPTLIALLKEYKHQDTVSREDRWRLLAMKEFAARMLEIPRRRLCDRILDYSPSAHQELAHHYANLWTALLRPSSEYGDIKSVSVANAARCRWMAELFVQKEKSLADLFRMVKLHWPIYRIASRHSTSGAVQEYAEAVCAIAAEGLAAFEAGANRDLADDWAKVEEQLGFLYQKQKAYPGIDIHATCARACEPLAGAELRHFFTSLPTGGLGTYDGTRQAKQRLEALLRALTELSGIVERCIRGYRADIVTKFCDHQLDWLKAALPSQAFIITHGYSKTVRAVLNDDDGRLDPFKILVVSSGDDDFEDARKMAYELKEKPKYADRVATAGQEDVLMGLINPGDRVMALLGAECFDNEPRVIHPRGARSKLMSIEDALERRKVPYRVVVVAESYKQQSGNLGDAEFFRNHLDRLDIYPANAIDAVITDKEVLPGLRGNAPRTLWPAER